MDAQDFDALLESVKQADAIVKGEMEPAGVTETAAYRVRNLRRSLNLSQPEFARLVHVSVGTIRNWEQGRREPEGPAFALLQALTNDPQHVIAAINR